MKPITIQMLAKWLDMHLERCLREDSEEAAGSDEWYDEARLFAAALIVVDWASNNGFGPREICRAEAAEITDA